MKDKTKPSHRRKRVRNLVRAMKRKYRDQQKKIDLLCKDMVDAHTIFSSKLEQVCFSSRMFEKLISCNSQKQVFEAIERTFTSTFKDMRISIYLSEAEAFVYHSDNQFFELPVNQHQLEACFSPELCNNIAQSTSVCNVEDMAEMAIQENLSLLRDITIAAIPLIKFGPTVGFILVWRSIENPLTKMQLEMLASTSSGIAKALTRTQIPVTQGVD